VYRLPARWRRLPRLPTQPGILGQNGIYRAEPPRIEKTQEGGKNMIALNVLLAVVAAVLLLGVIAENDKEKNKNITIAFVAVVALIIALNTIM
jgi:hypothetical protein